MGAGGNATRVKITLRVTLVHGREEGSMVSLNDQYWFSDCLLIKTNSLANVLSKIFINVVHTQLNVAMISPSVREATYAKMNQTGISSGSGYSYDYNYT